MKQFVNDNFLSSLGRRLKEQCEFSLIVTQTRHLSVPNVVIKLAFIGRWNVISHDYENSYIVNWDLKTSAFDRLFHVMILQELWRRVKIGW